MELQYLLLGLLGVLIARFLVYLIQRRYSPLWAVPGPFLARWTDWWYFWQVRKGHFEQINIDLHNKYGPVVRYGTNRFSFNDLESSKTIYGLGAHFPKSSWYDTFVGPGEVSLFADRDIKRHSNHRKLFQSSYSLTSLISYESYVNDCADIFSQRLSELSQSGSTVNMGYWFQCYAFDVIGLITYGKRLGFLDHGKDIGGVMHALGDFLSYAAVVGVFSRIHRFTFPLKNYLAGSEGAGRAYVISFTKERMREYTLKPRAIPVDSNVEPTEPFLVKFLKKSQDSPATFTSTHVAMGCVANMIAGSDTTSITLSAILYHLLKKPQCLRSLQEEVDEFYKDGRLSDKPTFQESQKMPYLQAVIKEALRIHPATGMPLERTVPKGGATISGHFFPEGTIVGINTWVQHRNQSIYGSDADKFRPERWLSDSEKVTIMNRYWIPFGMGSRTCLGKHISMLEISKVIPRIIREFDFELVAELERRETIWQTMNYWFVKPQNLTVKITRRDIS